MLRGSRGGRPPADEGGALDEGVDGLGGTNNSKGGLVNLQFYHLPQFPRHINIRLLVVWTVVCNLCMNIEGKYGTSKL